METLRLGTFETNSSSCHAFVLMAAKLYGDGKGWPKYFVVKWTRHGSEYDAGLGAVLCGEEAVEEVWSSFKKHASALTRAHLAAIIPQLAEGKNISELAEAYPSVEPAEWDELEEAFSENSMPTEDLVGGSFVQYGDTVGIAFEKEC